MLIKTVVIVQRYVQFLKELTTTPNAVYDFSSCYCAKIRTIFERTHNHIKFFYNLGIVVIVQRYVQFLKELTTGGGSVSLGYCCYCAKIRTIFERTHNISVTSQVLNKLLLCKDTYNF